jgi:Fic family protein
MATPRSYETSHPWITFNTEKYLNKLDIMTWARLGESYSKCQHLVGVPLMPAVAEKLGEIYLRRGALASAAIEGNTLSEKQVEDILVNKHKLPESQQYLEQEVRNVWTALYRMESEISKKVIDANDFKLTPEWIKNIHSQLLEGLELDDHVEAGEYRKVSVIVGNYRGVSAEDIPYLMEKFCLWIDDMRVKASVENARGQKDRAFIYTFFAATLAHLYFAWIHPFGDGNGRTARLIECAILAHSGQVPWISTNVLSDFYNRTRTRYYQKLEAASQNLEISDFIEYSALGFRDQLRDQVAEVQKFQRRVAWVNYVHEQFQTEPTSDAAKRRRVVVLAMPDDIELTSKEIRHLTPAIAGMYAKASEKLFKRDMGKLIEIELVQPMSKGKYQSMIWVMDAFKPQPESGSHLRSSND